MTRRTPAFAVLAMAAAACIQRGYPLGTTGTVDIRVDVAGPLYAAAALDAEGKAVVPRQDPHATGVTLFLSEGGQPAYSAYVDVRVTPPEALTLASDPGEDAPTCSANGGAFRCMASKEGYARFVARSDGVWSGAAKIQVTWGGNDPKEQPITVLPAGLPTDATGFTLLVGGLDQADRVLATYASLACTADAVPDDLGSKWPPGRIRVREAYVVATAPPASPGVLENAPVVIESLSAEAELSGAQDCADRSPRRVVLLAKNGQSEPFYLCFSDNGGTVRYGVTSGQKTIDPAPQVVVDPEPRLLRVRALKTAVQVTTYPVDVFEISAYSADRVRIAVPVDVRSGNDGVLALSVASLDLADEKSPATVLQALPIQVGTAKLHVTPRLLDQPDCTSPIVNVNPAPIYP